MHIDFDEIQKAMEDVSRDSFEYFLDTETGEVVTLSGDIINRAIQILNESLDEDLADFEEVDFDEEPDIPEWMDDEIELALRIFLYERSRYARIPERDSGNGFASMKEFAEGIDDEVLKKKLLAVLEGKGAFRMFKDCLEPYPKLRKKWYGFNANANRNVINHWLETLGIQGSYDEKKL